MVTSMVTKQKISDHVIISITLSVRLGSGDQHVPGLPLKAHYTVVNKIGYPFLMQ